MKPIDSPPHSSRRTLCKKGLKTALCALTMVALTVGLAYAQEHGGGEEGATMMDWVKRIVDFGLVAALLVYVFVKYIKGALKSRIEGIENALAEAKAAREEALKRLAAVEARLKDKDAEIKSLLKVAEDNGKKEKAQLIKDGKDLGEDIIASAKENIDTELVKAKDALRREAALLAMELAEKMVRENIKKEDQTRIVEEYIAKVGG
jgi:F-type H+-transporting ATPase subunit b